MRATILIPARLDSKRFPNKLLESINGETVIRRTIKKCLEVENIRVVVLTEDAEIHDHVWGLTECDITPIANNGTERIFNWLSQVDTDIIINVQGDEPFVSPRDIERLIHLLEIENDTIFTLDRGLDRDELRDRNTVKLMKYEWDEVYTFTRSPIYTIYSRFKKHIGIYGFRKSILESIAPLETSVNSLAESLEQLTWMDNNWLIKSITTQEKYISIDTELDLQKAIKYAKESES